MREPWLSRPDNIRKLWIGFIAVLVLIVLAELAIKRHTITAIDAIFAFNAWYGFAACVALILGARLLGTLLKRRDDYYE
jgi:hypothetical protein